MQHFSSKNRNSVAMRCKRPFLFAYGPFYIPERSRSRDQFTTEGARTGARACTIGFPSVCRFHCQQSAEKYLKALLEELGAAIPKTHDLEDLADLLLTHHRGMERVVAPARDAPRPSKTP